MIAANQNPEQLVRDRIDKMLSASGWLIQSKTKINLTANTGAAIWKYQADIGPADYILFLNKKPVGVIEAKREDDVGGRNFWNRKFKKQAGTLKYTAKQVQWLRMMKDYIANSFHVDKDDFELDPFNKQGGLGKMWQLYRISLFSKPSVSKMGIEIATNEIFLTS